MKLIVVGGGVVGAACAYSASGLGAQVVLVDAQLAGQATAAGAGIVCPWASYLEDPAWHSFACAAARRYPDLAAELADVGGDVSYQQVGALMIARDDDDARRVAQLMRDNLAVAPEIGEVQILSGEESKERFPPLRPPASAVYIGGAGRVDGRRLRDALIAVARRRGTEVRSGRARLACRSGRAIGVEIDGELAE